MLLKVKKQIEETLDVQTPCWLYSKRHHCHAHITADGDLIKVSKGCIVLYDRNGSLTESEIRETVNTYHSCIEADFKAALDKELFRLEDVVTGAKATA